MKQVSEFEKKDLFDPNNIAALIDKSKEETPEAIPLPDKTVKKIITLFLFLILIPINSYALIEVDITRGNLE